MNDPNHWVIADSQIHKNTSIPNLSFHTRPVLVQLDMHPFWMCGWHFTLLQEVPPFRRIWPWYLVPAAHPLWTCRHLALPSGAILAGTISPIAMVFGSSSASSLDAQHSDLPSAILVGTISVNAMVLVPAAHLLWMRRHLPCFLSFCRYHFGEYQGLWF
jgi:hypothetical protein